MQTLLPPSEPWQSKNKVTIDEELRRQHLVAGTASLGDRKQRIQKGLHELWEFHAVSGAKSGVCVAQFLLWTSRRQ
jgi:hypothetical protein